MPTGKCPCTHSYTCAQTNVYFNACVKIHVHRLVQVDTTTELTQIMSAVIYLSKLTEIHVKGTFLMYI